MKNKTQKRNKIKPQKKTKLNKNKKGNIFTLQNLTYTVEFDLHCRI